MKALFFVAGLSSLALAIVGVVVPLLPTTPFLLLASGCFVRSYPRCRELLLRMPLFGRTLQNRQR